MDDKVDEYGRNALHLLADIQFDLRTTVCNDSAESVVFEEDVQRHYYLTANVALIT